LKRPKGYYKDAQNEEFKITIRTGLIYFSQNLQFGNTNVDVFLG